VLAAAIALVAVPATAAVSPSPSSSGSGAPAADASVEPYDGLPTAIQDVQDEAGEDVSFAEAIELGKLVGEHQAETLGGGNGLAADTPALGPSTPNHDSPSAAAIALAARHAADHDVELGPDERADLQALDELDDPVRTELTDTIDAFLAFHAAAQGLSQPTPGSLDAVLEARNGLLDEIADLDAALAASQETPPTIHNPPFLSVDLDGEDNNYTEDTVLIIDAGGNDTYKNNAGGADNYDSHGGTGFTPAAALVDLGEDPDTYGAPKGLFGVTGGAAGAAAGFLVDGGGDDTYRANSWAVHGGAWGGGPYECDIPGLGCEDYDLVASGFLLDAGGDDTYDPHSPGFPDVGGILGVNGGGVDGSGTLIDVAGNDVYDAGDAGTNGGGAYPGAGLLADLAGDDSYTAENEGANGAAHVISDNDFPFPISGLVEDTVGDPPVSHGLLFDGAGTDTYEDDEGGTGTDKTVVPKGQGYIGAQLDHTPPGGGNR
jgi:hypothetical protein